MALEIAALGAHDRPARDAPARGDRDFHRTPAGAAEFDAARRRLLAAREIRGVGRALIEAVAQQARAAGAQRCYWLTQQDNHAARALYDKVARFHGFIRYDVAL